MPEPFADLVVTGTLLTVDEKRPTAQALAVRDGRIIAIGSHAQIAPFIGAATEVVDLGDGCALPGFVEAHGHPMMEAVVLSDRVVDIRPVTLGASAQVLSALHREVTARGAAGAYLYGWDPLLHNGLPQPTLAWLNEIAPNGPLVIVHNSGHKAYFNSAAAAAAGLSRDTPDPEGARYGRDADGNLDGTAEESAALLPLVLGGVLDPTTYPSLLVAECARLNRAGITTCSEMTYDPALGPMLTALHTAGALTVRLRTYEMSSPAMASASTPVNGDDMLKQVGIKVWVDGSPFVGNIALTFPYLDTEATRIIGVPPGSCGHANYSRSQLTEIVDAYFAHGWPIACHVMGDAGIDMILDVYADALWRHPRDDHRLRLEHVPTMRPDQVRRAVELGVTASMFVDQIHYWGDIIVDGLFGEQRGSHWMPAGEAVAAGMRISLHNDPPVTPEEPLRNISVAATRTAPSGRVLAPEERLTVEQAIRAQTLDAAWQLFADDIVGSLEVGKYADLVVLSADPRTVAPAEVAALDVRATYLAGRLVYQQH